MKLRISRALAVVLLVASAACSTVNKHVSKGYDAYSKQDYMTAEVEFQKALDDDKDDPYAQLNMGALYQATGRPQLAVQLYLKVLQTGKNVRPNRKTNNLTSQASPTLAEMAQANLDAIAAASKIK